MAVCPFSLAQPPIVCSYIRKGTFSVEPVPSLATEPPFFNLIHIVVLSLSKYLFQNIGVDLKKIIIKQSKLLYTLIIIIIHISYNN